MVNRLLKVIDNINNGRVVTLSNGTETFKSYNGYNLEVGQVYLFHGKILDNGIGAEEQVFHVEKIEVFA